MLRFGSRAFVGTLVAAALIGAPAARAIPPPEAPRSVPSPSASTVPAGATLPFGSTLLFVLDDRVDSGSTPSGTIVRMHLKAPLVVNGVTLAGAGAPGTFTIVTTRRAQTGNVDGAVQIHVDSFELPGHHTTLPIRAYHEYIDIERTAGQQSTRDTTDTVADVFVPYHVIYRALRKGRQMVLPVGSVLRAETGATIDATNPAALVLSTPPPFLSTYDTPHADLTAPPLYTPAPMRPKPLPKGKPTLPPTAPPTPETSAAPAASPGAAAPAAQASPAASTTPAAPTASGSPAFAASPIAAASPSSPAASPSP